MRRYLFSISIRWRILSHLLFASSLSESTFAFTYGRHVFLHNRQLLQQRQTPRKQQQSFFAVVQDKVTSSKATKISKVSVGDLVGSGSYGTVHILNATSSNKDPTEEHDDNIMILIGKRPWNKDELATKLSSTDAKQAGERASRCQYYWEVEEHCFAKLPPHPQLPPYYGTNGDWMLFGLVGDVADDKQEGDANMKITPAPTLSELMILDCDRPQELMHIGTALGCDDYSCTVDKTLELLLTVLAHVHTNQIVHRDIKPANLLVHNGTLLLLDFGSAADLEPSGGILQRRRGLENGNRVAVSPIYCAPEVFIDVKNHPTKFDLFSSGLLICQLLFAYLDERVDAGFHQQLQEAGWDLSLWLSNELTYKVRPQGLPHALEYLSERPGLWTLLQDMLSKDPSDRPTASEALSRLKPILEGDGPQDGPFFTMVIESMDTCDIPVMSQPLHFVATFSLDKPLGLILSERDHDDDGEDEEMDSNQMELWRHATHHAQDGEVFVKEVIEGGQADKLGIFEIGDRLQGIGELPFNDGGFEKAVKMLNDQYRKSRNVRLHFDRLSVRSNEAIPMVPSEDVEIAIVDQGAWSFKGRRKAQEDRFVLHEIHDARDRSVLLAGVLDGHGGIAASRYVADSLPTMLSQELLLNDTSPSAEFALRHAWESVCEEYRFQCTEDSCSADYDPKEGLLMANTGSEDLVAGTTATMFGLDEMTGKLSVLNCGDSRSIVIQKSGDVQFATADHTPQAEYERLEKGIEVGLNYSLPECRVSRWFLPVGIYEYGLCRSLEGPFATSKGIISDPDVTSLQAEAGMILVSASDGLYDVMGNSEVAKFLTQARDVSQMSARDAAKELSKRAMEKGTVDNVSVVVIYL